MKKYCIKLFMKLSYFFKQIRDNLITLSFTYECKEIGKAPSIEFPISTLGLQCFMIGDNLSIKKDCKFRAYKGFASQKFNPEISIGSDFYMGTQCNILIIGCLNIGNHVTLASRVTIVDHSHGKLDENDIDVPVMKRELFCKGPIYIADNVWIGEGAVILGGVSIGKNSVIAANAVVTRNIPSNTIVAGVPAKAIKTIANKVNIASTEETILIQAIGQYNQAVVYFQTY